MFPLAYTGKRAFLNIFHSDFGKDYKNPPNKEHFEGSVKNEEN
jgi:hypothetical protein